jgi:hypothetical protein
MTGTTVPNLVNLPSNDEITQFDGTRDISATFISETKNQLCHGTRKMKKTLLLFSH